MINVENLNKSFGGQTLFDRVSFQVNPRERVGLVGRNGHGKTTLLRILTGNEAPDSGSVIIPKNYRIGHVRQHLSFSRKTLLEEGMTGLVEAEKDHYWKVEKILTGLGFSETDMGRHPDEFSGGFQVRLNLAKVLVSEPDLLLLDEPTNYLDITSIRWIIRFLNAWPRELLLITHDRGFMDQVITHVVGIHRQKARKVSGNTEKYYSQLAQDEEVYEKTRLNDERKRKEIELFITRFRAKARLANLVQSRVKTLAKMEKKDKLQSLQGLDFTFRSKPFSAKHVMSTEGLGFAYNPDTPLIENLDLSVNPRDRICVIGKNGRGKTTLLKLLAAALKPATGQVIYNPNVEVGFFEQTNIQSLIDSRTVEDEILYADAGVDRQQARNIAGAMMFSGDNALKTIRVLSGGEKSRVMLGKLLVTPVNLLLLDEPTNHLDMDACDAMLAAIDAFDGTVIMVTHNEMFLHALAERLIIFQSGGVHVFEGGYQAFLDRWGWEEEGGLSGAAVKNEKQAKNGPADPAPPGGGQPVKPKANRKKRKRQRTALLGERSRVLKPLKQAVSRLENSIETNENDLASLNGQMVTAAENSDGKQIADLSRAIHRCQARIDRMFDELETASTAYEQQKKSFDQKLSELEAEL
jgi:ATP-binding cassette, subfamily F, member 3